MEFLNDATTAAKLLLGWKLVHESPEGRTAGIIVETEAYNSADPASHTFRGLTPRTAPMFEAAGTIYVYFSYGMHFCMNIVTGEVGQGQAVLIRALEPTEGLELMAKRRSINNKLQLCNGPGKLTQAMGIHKTHSGQHLMGGPISLLPGIKPLKITAAKRIGISRAKDKLWRFYITDNPFVSRK